jgi:hypothetical protein
MIYSTNILNYLEHTSNSNFDEEGNMIMRLTKETFGGVSAAADENNDIHDTIIKVEDEVGITCGSETECHIHEMDDE